ncbi:Chemotaxis protein CheY [Planctomycetes bacterium Pan216]|uniref:Chemotaxis protein CheY n=1 Tax=Kolteria novifilia TaxID=2527975 RepID=A0A518BCN4_9BACT|nr:Chemotaxis protein CheY [Planctomycetes bacterium Pan216]
MSKNLLIVDDALFMRMVIKDVAKEAGWTVAGEASDGCEAVALFDRLRPNLVTLDLVMPNMGGLEALGEMLKIEPTASVVVVSALDQKDTLVEAIRLGARDFIVKPFEKDRILGLLDKASGG